MDRPDQVETVSPFLGFGKKGEKGDGPEPEEPDDAPIEHREDLGTEKQPLPPIETDEQSEKTYVLESAVPYNNEGGPLVPRKEKFAHFTIDRSTLVVLDKIATAAELGDPCLLEGETSTSKTSSIEYLAMRTNHELVRINLNGQTDTSELIGKYVPNDGKLQIDFEQALKNPDLLKEESRSILKAANSEGRGLTLLESQKIAAHEGIDSPDWRWQDGIVPQGMRKGWWIILDEINLAEPQILERINSVLERNPSLTISEQGNTKIEGEGEGENKLDPRFRIFATMNPAEYSGRQPMSPAYKDRWTSYIYVDPPSVRDYLAMGVNMVYGEQPKVDIRGTIYQAEASKPLERIREVPNMREFLAKLAQFEVKLEEMAKNREIGKGRKEKYIFTRRGLIEFFEFLEQKTIYDRKNGESYDVTERPKEIVLRGLQYYFLDKIAGREDLKKVTDLMGAIGISETNWTVEFTEKAEKSALKQASQSSESQTEEQENAELRKGDSVRIAEVNTINRHGGQTGTILAVLEDGRFQVRIEEGCTHEYVLADLEKIPQEKSKGEKGERVRFTWDGGRSGETTGDYSVEGFRFKTGDLLRAKAGGDLRSDIRTAKKLEIIGFAIPREESTPFPILRVDGGRCFYVTDENAFEVVEP
jgi:MoxR-like ATPase